MNDYKPFPSTTDYQSFPFKNGTTINHNNNTLSTLSIDDKSDIKNNNNNSNNSNDQAVHSSIINNKLKKLDIRVKINNNNINNTHVMHSSHPNTPQTLIQNNKNGNVVLFTDANDNDLSLKQTHTPNTPSLNPIKSDPQPQISQNILSPPDNTNNNTTLSSLLHDNNFEAPSRCTNDPGAPIISLEKAKKEFKTVSQAAFRFQFVCDAYRRCKIGSVKEKDFAKFEDVINYVHDQLLKRRQRSLQNNKSTMPTTPISDADDRKTMRDMIRPSLSQISAPVCSICNKSFPTNHCYTTCNHPLCIKCLVNTFNQNPKNPRWYMCAVNGCRAMLPPQAHFLVLSYKPSSPPTSASNTRGTNKMLYKKMLSEYVRVRNISYKNMLKIVGEYFSSKLKGYDRWRKCENCDFGFLADPDVSWYQVFELKCVVCSVIQRVQLLGPDPCNRLSLKKNYYPNDAMFKSLIFIRHGEAENNIRPSDPNLRDPNLTNRGKEQCKHLNQFFGCMISVDCILSSSMNRCMQTAIIGIYKKDKKIPFIVLECLRERLAPMFNRRETITVKKEKYKSFHIDFSQCKCDNDLYFDVEKKNEKYQDMNKRAWQFYKYLIQRKEQNIAVVSHEGMLQCLMNIIDANDKCLTRSFKNAEARLCFLTHRK